MIVIMKMYLRVYATVIVTATLDIRCLLLRRLEQLLALMQAAAAAEDPTRAHAAGDPPCLLRIAIV